MSEFFEETKITKFREVLYFLMEEFPVGTKMESSMYSAFDTGTFKRMRNISEEIGT